MMNERSAEWGEYKKSLYGGLFCGLQIDVNVLA